MKLNNIPVKTTNSFGVNNIAFDITIPDIEISNYNQKGLEITSTIENNLNSKLGLETNKYLLTTITLEKYKTYKEPIILENNITNLMEKISIEAKENSDADITLIYRGKNAFHYLVIDTNIEQNSNIKLTIINLLDNNSQIFTSINNKVLENASLSTNIIEIEGKVKLSNYYTDILGTNAKNYLNSIYFGKNEDIIDINYDIKNIGRNTTSYINTIGVLNDKSTKTMKMSIDFVKGASKSVGEEYEKCILLSDDAVSKSVPLLLCTEEDVQGVHSVATGKIEEDKLFYCMSRGFDYKDSIKTIINGDLNKVIENVTDISIKEEIISKVYNTI